MKPGPFRLSLVIVLALAMAAASTLGGSDAGPHRPGLEGYLRGLGYVPINLKYTAAQQLVVDGKVNGKKVQVLITTGDFLTTLQDRLAAPLYRAAAGKNVVVVDPVLGRVQNTNLVVLDQLELGSAAFASQPAVGRRGTSGAPLRLGCDFLLRHFALLDSLDQRLYVREKQLTEEARKTLEATLRASRFVRVPLGWTRVAGPFVDAKTGDVPLRLLVETGTGYTLLDNNVLQSLGRTDLYWAPLVLRQAHGKDPRSIATADLPELTMGEVVLHKVRVGITELKAYGIGESRGDLGDIHGVLGNEWLARSGALLDLCTSNLWVSP